MKKFSLAFLSLILAVLLTACSSAEKSGYFGDTKWGMSLNEVNDAVDFLLIETEENITYSAVAPEEIKFQLLDEINADLDALHFDFKKDQLKAVRITLTPKEGTMKDMLEKARKYFDELYEPDEDANSVEIWTTDTGTVSIYALNAYLFVDYAEKKEE